MQHDPRPESGPESGPESNRHSTRDSIHDSTIAPAAASIAGLASNLASASVRRAKLLSKLALAEARLAATSLALMAFLAMLAAAFVLGAWSLLMAGLVHGLLQLQVPLWPLLLALAGLHVLLATLAWRFVLALSGNLEFNHTRSQIAGPVEPGSHTGHNREPDDDMAATTAPG